MSTKVHARLIEVGSELSSLSGSVGQSYATFEGPTGEPGFRIAITREQAREIAPMLYRWCYLTIELSGVESTGER